MEYIDQMLQQILDANPSADRTKIMVLLKRWMDHYRDQASKYINDPETRLDTVQEFQRLVDESVKKLSADTMKNVTCKKGCAHCCHVQVITSLAEAQYILSFCKKNNIPIDTGYIRQQAATLNEPEDYTFSNVRKCVFLSKEKTCIIYKARPLTCRRYFVITDPEMCNIQNGIQKVGIVATLEGDLMQGGLIAADQDYGNFSKMLLKAIELDNAARKL